MPSAARLHRRAICDGNSGASVATTQMIEPALRTRLPASRVVGRQDLADRNAVDAQGAHDAEVRLHQHAQGVAGRLAAGAEMATRRELVPMPALKSQVIRPVPAPTEPSATGAAVGLLDGAVDVLGADVAADGVVEPRVVALAHDGDDHVVLAADAGKAAGSSTSPRRPTPCPRTWCW